MSVSDAPNQIKASACMVTKVAEAKPVFIHGRWQDPAREALPYMLYFEGHGPRRVYKWAKSGRTVVRLNGRWRRVNMDDLTVSM